jgi:hypothetical protein
MLNEHPQEFVGSIMKPSIQYIRAQSLSFMLRAPPRNSDVFETVSMSEPFLKLNIPPWESDENWTG